ncbi:MAG TPA: cytochrome d ubiquinol oxidase subunit II, partial [Bacteroidales bacterium]|nr:cytochrome d ubiquinol oxidase subunit II [Bacteroidales bacterium]
MMSHAFLQHYWWIVISLLGGLLGFLMFVQGGQTFIYSLPANAMQRKMIVNALGRKWEFTFTTLVTFGGAFFASFPLFYATSFGGAYWLWMLILFSFVIQAVAYEYRSKPSNVLGSNTYDIFLLLNGSLGPFLTGIAVATFFTGAHFSLDNLNRVTWQTNLH